MLSEPHGKRLARCKSIGSTSELVQNDFSRLFDVVMARVLGGERRVGPTATTLTTHRACASSHSCKRKRSAFCACYLPLSPLCKSRWLSIKTTSLPRLLANDEVADLVSLFFSSARRLAEQSQ